VTDSDNSMRLICLVAFVSIINFSAGTEQTVSRSTGDRFCHLLHGTAVYLSFTKIPQWPTKNKKNWSAL